MLHYSSIFVIGQLYVAGNEYRGVAPGTFRGLDLREDFYVGGVPDYSRISTASGYRQVPSYIFLISAIKLMIF